ncbi:hypothetical protein [Bradyrhizobium sp. USDA 4529]
MTTLRLRNGELSYEEVVPLLSIKDVAAALSVSPQWLKYWLVDNPVDADGVPFYVRMGNRLKFESKDIERILTHLRLLEAARLGPSIKSKARLAGLMSHVGGYDHLLAVREAAKRRREAASGAQPRSLIADLAVSGVLGSSHLQKRPRARLPRAPKRK